MRDTGTGIKNEVVKKMGLLNVQSEGKMIGLGLTISNYLATLVAPLDRLGIFFKAKVGKSIAFTSFIDRLMEWKLIKSNVSSFYIKQTLPFLNLSIYFLLNQLFTIF